MTTSLPTYIEQKPFYKKHTPTIELNKYKAQGFTNARYLSIKERHTLLDLASLQCWNHRLEGLKKHNGTKKQFVFVKARIRESKKNIKQGLKEYAPHEIAKILRVDVAVVYRVFRQFGNTGSVLFRNELEQRGIIGRATGSRKNRPRNLEQQTVNPCLPVKDGCVQCSSEHSSPRFPTAECPYCRTVVEDSDIPPVSYTGKTYKEGRLYDKRLVEFDVWYKLLDVIKRMNRREQIKVDREGYADDDMESLISEGFIARSLAHNLPDSLIIELSKLSVHID